MSSRRGGHQKWDAKKMTMRKLVQYDSDLAPRFDDDDEQQDYEMRYYRALPRYQYMRGRGKPDRGRGSRSGSAQIRLYLEDRQEKQLHRSIGGTSGATAVIMNQIRVPKGAIIGKEFILRSIGQYVENLKPTLVRTDRSDLTFFIEDNEAAAAIQSISRRIHDPKTGAPITLLKNRMSAGYATVKSGERQLLHEALEKRYKASEHSMDLSEFGLDELFRARGLHLALSRNNIMMSVIELIDEYYGDVVTLSLKGNRLRFLDFFACLLYRIKNVKALDLSANQIDKKAELEKLKGWPVETLYFEDNPLCATFETAEEYLSAIHSVFPKVTMLDGIPVQRAISASDAIPDLDGEPNTPTSKPSFYGNEDRRALIEAFIIEYMTVYDDANTNNRKNLIDAYDENATFTLVFENIPDINDKKLFYSEDSTFMIYRRSSHNIIHLDKWERHRDKLLHKGAMDVIVELRKLPPTKHLMETFIVDVSMVTERFMCFTVQGFFRDGVNVVKDDDEVKYFCRNFVVVSKGERKIAIVSDMLFISGVYLERVQRYKGILANLTKVPSEPQSSKTLTDGVAEMAVTDGSVQNQDDVKLYERAAAGDQELQVQMVESFCRESGMKPEWSRKCLIDQNWNYAAAGQAFLSVRSQIPAEAFN